MPDEFKDDKEIESFAKTIQSYHTALTKKYAKPPLHHKQFLKIRHEDKADFNRENIRQETVVSLFKDIQDGFNEMLSKLISKILKGSPQWVISNKKSIETWAKNPFISTQNKDGLDKLVVRAKLIENMVHINAFLDIIKNPNLKAVLITNDELVERQEEINKKIVEVIPLMLLEPDLFEQNKNDLKEWLAQDIPPEIKEAINELIRNPQHKKRF
jgi:hypothetical protein